MTPAFFAEKGYKALLDNVIKIKPGGKELKINGVL